MGRRKRRTFFMLTLVFSLVILTFLSSGCTRDWSERWGLKPLWRTVVCPFEPYPLERLLEELVAAPPLFGFVVLGSTSSASNESSRGEGTTTYESIMADVRSINPQPRFIVHMGDVGENPGDTGAWEQLIRRSLPFVVGFSEGVLPDTEARPYFLLPGDRDVDSQGTEKTFLERFFRASGEVFFSFDWENFHFVALNSEEVDDGWLMEYFGFNRLQNRIIGPQWTWLEEDLRENRGKQIVVFIHKPLFPPVFSRHDGYCLDQYYSERGKLLDLLGDYSVKVVFMGHEPIFHWARIQDAYHIVTGGGGRKPRASRRLGGFYHFLYVTIDQGHGMTVYCIDPDRNTVEQMISVM